MTPTYSNTPAGPFTTPPVVSDLMAARTERLARWERATRHARRVVAAARFGSVGLVATAVACVAAVSWVAFGSDLWTGHRQDQLAAQLAAGDPVDIDAIQAYATSRPAAAAPISAFATFETATASQPVAAPAISMPTTDRPADPAAGTPVGPADPVTAAEEDPTFGQATATPADGSPVAQIHFPTLGQAHTVVAGTSVPALRNGPGWMIGTAFAGAPGNTVISGHRTTYGGPVRHLDQLAVGDQIVVTSPGRSDATYEVRAVFTVDPSAVAVTTPTTGVRLTLTTCHPVGSAAERLIVQAELVAGDHVAQATPADAWVPMR